MGDKEANVLRDAADLLNHAPYYEDMFKDYRDRVKNPEIYARKKALHDEFQNAAFGKEKYVVPRKIQQLLVVNAINAANPPEMEINEKGGE